MIYDLRRIKSIPKNNSYETIQNNCKVPLRKIIDTLIDKYGNSIISFYLYGSFSRGDGILKKSDLDLFIVTNKKINLREDEIKLAPQYKKYFSDLNFFSKTKKEILRESNGWLTFLKLFCVYTAGKEIRLKKSQLKVDRKLIRDLLEDKEILSLNFKKIDTRLRIKKLSKIMIINVYYATLDKHMIWATTLDEQVKVLKKNVPDIKDKIEVLYQTVKGKNYSYQKINKIRNMLRKIPLEWK